MTRPIMLSVSNWKMKAKHDQRFKVLKIDKNETSPIDKTPNEKIPTRKVLKELFTLGLS